MDRTLRWFEMGIGEQRRFYEKAVELLNLTCADPKNKFRLGELQFCIEELTDFFVGTNQYNTTDEMLMKYYDAFLV